MGQYSFELMPGVYGTGHTENDIPTREELEMEKARQLDAMQPTSQRAGVSVPKGEMPAMGSTPAVMSAVDPETALRRSAQGTAEQLLASQSALAETKADRYSALGGLAAGAAAVPLTGGMGSAPAALAARSAIQMGASALGATLGKRAGYELPGKFVNMSDYESPEGPGYKWEQSVNAGITDAKVNLLMMGLGTGARLGSEAMAGSSNMLANKFFGLNTPEVINEAAAMRRAGLRPVPLDVGGKLAQVYAKVVSIVPIIGGKLHTAQGLRQAETRETLKGLIGPSESGLNFVNLGNNFIGAANNAYKARKNWYEFLFGDLDRYAEANPHLRVSNNAIDPARAYIYEQSRRATGTARTASTNVRTTTATTKLAEGRTATVNQRTDMLSGDVTESANLTNKGQVSNKATTGETATTRTSVGQVRNFTGSHDVDALISDVANSTDEILTIPQYNGMHENITQAFEHATPNQQRILTQMRENLDSALEQTGDAGYTQRLQQARASYQETMKFFENPQSRIFVQAAPDKFATRVKALDAGRPGFATLMPSQVAEALTKDLTPEGIEALARMAGPDNMKDLADYYVSSRFSKHVEFLPDGSNKVNWDGLRSEFGLGGTPNRLSLAMDKMLQAGGSRVSRKELGETIDMLEKYGGGKLPALSTMLARSASLGGMKGAGRNIFAGSMVAGAATLGGKALTVALLVGSRRFTKFLTDPTRIKVLKAALSGPDEIPGMEMTGKVFRPIGPAGVATSQLLRYFAGDLVRDKAEGRRPTEKEIDVEYERLKAEYDSMLKAGQTEDDMPKGMNPLEDFATMFRKGLNPTGSR